MYIFHDPNLNLFRFHPGKLPEKPKFSRDYEAENISESRYWENYDNAIAAIKKNALTIQNPEILKQFDFLVLSKHGEFIVWPGGYETKETLSDGWVPSYNDPDNSGWHPSAEPIIVAILTLPEKKNTMKNSDTTNTTEKLTLLFEKHNPEFRFDPHASHRWIVNAFREYAKEISSASDSVATPKITPERAKEIEEPKEKEERFARLKWQVGQILSDKFLEYNDGKFHAAIELNPATHALTEFVEDKIAYLRDQLEKQGVAFRETVKIQGEEVARLKNRLKELGDNCPF